MSADLFTNLAVIVATLAAVHGALAVADRRKAGAERPADPAGTPGERLARRLGELSA